MSKCRVCKITNKRYVGPLPVPHLCMCMYTCLCGVCAHAVLVTFLPPVLDRMEGPVWLVASAGLVHHHEAAHIVIEGS